MKRWFRFIRKGHLMILGALKRLEDHDQELSKLRKRTSELESSQAEMHKAFAEAIAAVNAPKPPAKPGPIRVRTMTDFRAAVGDGTAPQPGETNVP